MTIGIQLGQKYVTATSSPYIISEIGVNHGGSLDQAKKLIDQSKAGGADAAKFQTYKAGKLASKHSPSYWDTTKETTRSQYQLFKKYDGFGPDEYMALVEHCADVGIDFLSTPFDRDAVDFLDQVVPFFKIASADLTNKPFLQQIASKGKPIVLSTGASTLGEIDTALSTIAAVSDVDVALLHCVLNYPTPNENAHLRMIEGLKRAYPQHIIGYSDHTLPDEAMTPVMTAYLLGAVIIEKHFTHDKTLPGNDHYHAMDQADLERLTMLLDRTQTLLGGKVHKEPLATEAISRENARRSVVLTRNIRKGEVLGEADITYKRPGTGISPLHWDDVIGATVIADLEEDHILQWSDIAKG